MTQMSDGTVMVSVAVRGLPPGQHGIHIHAVGSCTPTFAAAGPHYNPAQKQHGLDNPNGPHAGDLPNLTMGASGAGTFTAMTNRVTITGGPNTIFDSDGSALVIHALVDDQKTDPAGNSGDRIACAVVQPGTPAGAQAGGATGGQTGAGQPSRLPTTGGAETPWLALIAGALLLCVGALAVHRARARG